MIGTLAGPPTVDLSYTPTSRISERDLHRGYARATAQICPACASFPCRCYLPRSVPPPTREKAACSICHGLIEPRELTWASIAEAVLIHNQSTAHERASRRQEEGS